MKRGEIYKVIMSIKSCKNIVGMYLRKKETKESEDDVSKETILEVLQTLETIESKLQNNG